MQKKPHLDPQTWFFCTYSKGVLHPPPEHNIVREDSLASYKGHNSNYW